LGSRQWLSTCEELARGDLPGVKLAKVLSSGSHHTFDPAAIDTHAGLMRGHLSEISTEGLSIRLHSNQAGLLLPELRNALSEAVVDLAALIDEIRFSGSLAALLIADYERSVAVDTESDETKEMRDLGIPIAALALLAPYYAPLPFPASLVIEPHKTMAGGRVLSLWFAGQMLDSALFRVVAALDRLAIILWCSASLPFESAHGRVRYPAFRPTDLAKLAGSYSSPSFGQLEHLAHHPLFELLLRVRHGFTHSSRPPSELHGHYRLAYDVGGPVESDRITQAIDRETHMAILLATYNEILRAAVHACSECLSAAPSPPAS